MRPPSSFRATTYNREAGSGAATSGHMVSHTPECRAWDKIRSCGGGPWGGAALACTRISLGVCEDGATRAEQNLVAGVKSDLVRFRRGALHRAMAPQLVAAVERLTSRDVRPS
jgi:hypothetical protein